MFQTGSVQRNAFQLGGQLPEVASAAFQQGAFQGGAFQVYSGYQNNPVPTPTVTGGWSDWMPRKPRRKDEDEEEKEVERPLEVVTTDKVVTGVVQAVPPLPAWRDPAPDSEVARLVRHENESKAAFRRRLKKIIAADDDWLMLH